VFIALSHKKELFRLREKDREKDRKKDRKKDREKVWLIFPPFPYPFFYPFLFCFLREGLKRLPRSLRKIISGKKLRGVIAESPTRRRSDTPEQLKISF